jgi:hypothetical protein
MSAKTVSISSLHNALIPVPAGKGRGVAQFKLDENLVVSQNSDTAGLPLKTWRLLLIPWDEFIAPAGSKVTARYWKSHGEKCPCGAYAAGGIGIRQPDGSITHIKEVCQKHLLFREEDGRSQGRLERICSIP